MSVTIHSFSCGQMANLSYVIEDINTKTCVIIDPTWDIETLLTFISTAHLSLTQIWLTHSHFDHIQGLDECNQLNPNIPLVVHSEEAFKFENNPNSHIINHMDTLILGDSTWQVIHTPGHSPGGVCFYNAPHLISGDTLFIDRCGRADITGANVDDLYDSLQHLKAFPEDTIIYPGHDYASKKTDTIGNQLTQNPYLKAGNRDAFIRLRMK